MPKFGCNVAANIRHLTFISHLIIVWATKTVCCWLQASYNQPFFMFIFLICVQIYLISDPYKQEYSGYPQQGYPQGYPPQQAYQPQGYPQPGAVQPGFAPIPTGAPYGHIPPVANQHVPYSDGNSSDPIVKGFDFSEESIRRGFIRKVYSILTVRIQKNFN